MNAEQESAAVRRLTVALDAAICEGADFEAAADLAQLLGAELHALFVEDPDLLALAGLPVAREVARVGARARQPDLDTVLAALRRQVQRAEGALTRTGVRRMVTVSCSTERGKLVRQALAQQGRPDGVLLLPRASYPGAAREPAPRAARSGGAGRPVIAWYDASVEGRNVLELAARIARRSGSELYVAFREGDREVEAMLRALVRESLQRRDTPVWLRPLAASRVDLLVGAARAVRAGQLVMACGGPLASEDALAALFMQLATSLILVRG
jgi:hypothetical protein